MFDLYAEEEIEGAGFPLLDKWVDNNKMVVYEFDLSKKEELKKKMGLSGMTYYPLLWV